MHKGPKTLRCNNGILRATLFSYIWQLSEANSLNDKQFTQEELDNLSSPISVNKIEFIVKNLLTKKSPDLNCFTCVLPKEETVSFIYKLSQEIKEMNTSKLILGGHSTLIAKDMTKKEKYEKRETNIVMNKVQKFSVKY